MVILFSSHGCVNCVRTLPRLRELHERLGREGLVLVGVHALSRHKLEFPVAMDNDHAVWRAWRTRFWPTQHILDEEGRIACSRVGEGAYEEMEDVVRRLLAE